MANAKRAGARARSVKTVDVGTGGDVRACAAEVVAALRGGGANVVVVVGIGVQVSKTVAVAELVKSSFGREVHQCTTYAPVTVKDAKATEIRIELATTSDVLDTSSPGYQGPDSIMGEPSPRKRKTVKIEPALPLKKKFTKAFAEARSSSASGEDDAKNAAPSA